MKNRMSFNKENKHFFSIIQFIRRKSFIYVHIFYDELWISDHFGTCFKPQIGIMQMVKMKPPPSRITSRVLIGYFGGPALVASYPRLNIPFRIACGWTADKIERATYLCNIWNNFVSVSILDLTLLIFLICRLQKLIWNNDS